VNLPGDQIGIVNVSISGMYRIDLVLIFSLLLSFGSSQKKVNRIFEHQRGSVQECRFKKTAETDDSKTNGPGSPD
jgi:hypothetical protein